MVWNKGLTKETDPRVAKNAKGVSKARTAKYFPAWNKGLSANPNSPNYDSRLAWCLGDLNPSKRPEVKAKISKKMKENNPMFNTIYKEKQLVVIEDLEEIKNGIKKTSNG